MAVESKGAGAAGIAIITAIFAAAAAWPVPDVNEAVYLTKARHFSDPAWGSGDFFLETPAAHGVFYALFGPLTAGLPLEQAAWIGRGLGWIALAAGFWYAVVPLVRTFGGRLIAAAVFSLALRQTTMAGEWVLGGCEAKVFSWALVLAALGAVGRGRFAMGWLLAGAATALHPIVGGWSMVAVAVAGGLSRDRDRGPFKPSARTVGLVLGLVIGGGLLAALGVVPSLGLSADADAAERIAATRSYVVERLSHHLLPRTFSEPLVARHVLTIVTWWLLGRLAPAGAARLRVDRFTLAAIAISAGGWAIALLEPVAADPVFSLLRFYWFRLADVIVPFSLAANAAVILEDDAACERVLPVRPAGLRAVVVLLLCADLAAQSRHWPLPGRVGLLPRADAKVDAAAWADICDWVRRNTPADACFLTPRGAATFTWRTGRREVVSWKNSPQDVRSLVEWRRRITDCFSHDDTLTGMEQSTLALGAERLRLVADRYGAEFAIVPVDLLNAAGPDGSPPPWRPVHLNDGYAVLRLEALPATPKP